MKDNVLESQDSVSSFLGFRNHILQYLQAPGNQNQLCRG